MIRFGSTLLVQWSSLTDSGLGSSTVTLRDRQIQGSAEHCLHALLHSNQGSYVQANCDLERRAILKTVALDSHPDAEERFLQSNRTGGFAGDHQAMDRGIDEFPHEVAHWNRGFLVLMNRVHAFPRVLKTSESLHFSLPLSTNSLSSVRSPVHRFWDKAHCLHRQSSWPSPQSLAWRVWEVGAWRDVGFPSSAGRKVFEVNAAALTITMKLHGRQESGKGIQNCGLARSEEPGALVRGNSIRREDKSEGRIAVIPEREECRYFALLALALN